MTVFLVLNNVWHIWKVYLSSHQKEKLRKMKVEQTLATGTYALVFLTLTIPLLEDPFYTIRSVYW